MTLGGQDFKICFPKSRGNQFIVAVRSDDNRFSVSPGLERGIMLFLLHF